MTDTPTDSTPGLVARAIGVILSPGETFRAVVAKPRPVGILFVVCLLLAVATVTPMLTDAGQRAMIDTQVEQMERFTGQPVSAEQYEQMRQGMATTGPIFGTISIFIFVPVITLLMSALFWALFNVAFGGTATFGQVLAVMAHAQVIGALGALLGLPIQLMSGTFSQAGPFNLGPLAVGLAADHPLALLLGGLSVFSLWQAVVTGIGLATLYQKRPGGIITIVVLISIVITALFTIGPSMLIGR